MRNQIRLEEFVMFAISVYALYFFQQMWWVYVLLLFAPDIGMLGYLPSNVSGAFCYNLFHSKTVAILFFLSGIFFNNQILLITGIILFGHSSLDRILVYGLKCSEGFGYTFRQNRDSKIKCNSIFKEIIFA